MAKTLDQLIQQSNLVLAWRRVQSNPSPNYKNYFRKLYANYAIGETALLSDLHDRLKRGVYKPAHSCKVYLPKGSGGLRPITLLTVEDQIVYQAFMNVIAEKFAPTMSKFYLNTVFSHICAGVNSPFFYNKWEEGFELFNKLQRRAFKDGLRFTAHFDLTACYDSLDHNVLKHFLLDELGCDQEFCRRLCNVLSYWTATGLNKRRVYQGHGIPQGPLCSGMLAEVMLHQFDVHLRHAGVRKLRYVDDIRLYAKSEKEVRAAVYDLDLLSKEIGLFPQTAKIKIHEVHDIEDELKSVSRPDDKEFGWNNINADQDRVHHLLAELSPRFHIKDMTRFTYLLGKAVPRAETNARLWRILKTHSDLYGNILSYFSRYCRLPKKDCVRLVSELKEEELHGVKIADLIRTADGRLVGEGLIEIDAICKKHWRNRTKLSTVLTAILGQWGMRRGLLTAEQAEQAIVDMREWYTRAEMIRTVDNRAIPQPGFNRVLLAKLDDSVSDVAIAAAVHLGFQGTVVDASSPMHIAAGPILTAFGVLDGVPKRTCGITHAFERLFETKPPTVDWRRFFGKTYRQAERQAVRWSGYLIDATAWVNGMDVFCDWMLDALYRKDPSIGAYKLGNIGSVLNIGGRLESNYSKVFELVKDIHERRSESDLSHPKKRIGSTFIKPTSIIKFEYFKRAKKLVFAALTELKGKWPIAAAKLKKTNL